MVFGLLDVDVLHGCGVWAIGVWPLLLWWTVGVSEVRALDYWVIHEVLFTDLASHSLAGGCDIPPC